MSDSKSGANHYLYGRTHTPESKAQMSDSKSGANNPMYGRTGALHPRFGITPTHALTVNVYSAVDNQLVRSFSSRVACAKWLDVSNKTVRNYIKSGKVWMDKYVIRNSASS
jgi:group I intron endonuclease